MTNILAYAIRCTFLVLLLAAAGSTHAQQDKPQQPVPQDSSQQGLRQGVPAEHPNQYERHIRNSADLEIDGLIVDKTVTKAGRDFYDVFQRQWEAPPAAKNFTIVVEEMPSRGTVSVVSLSVNDTKLFEQALQPRYDIIEEMATYMVGVVYEYLLNDELNKQLEAEGKKEREQF